MDIVITHVDFDNKSWKANFNNAKIQFYNTSCNIDSISSNRFKTRGELKYILRSIHANMEWARCIYLVVDDSFEPPSWLTGVTIIRHSDIIPLDYLPTFNSQAIETMLHKIPNISEPFLYFNDDMFVTSPVEIEDLVINDKFAVMLSDHFSKVGIPSIREIGFRSAWKNVNRLLDIFFEDTPRQKLEHCPYLISPSVMETLWKTWPIELNQTLNSRFRNIFNVNVAPALHPWFSLHDNLAFVQSNLKTNTVYIDFNKDFEINVGDCHFLCIEDETECEIFNQRYIKFLEKLFPESSKYEEMEPMEQQLIEEIEVQLIKEHEKHEKHEKHEEPEEPEENFIKIKKRWFNSCF